jgi:carbonic anhydrase
MTRVSGLWLGVVYIAALSGCKSKPVEPPDESKTPYTMPGLEHGLLQSPVNILSNEIEGGQHQISVNYHDAEPRHLENKGTTIELDFPEGSSITFDGQEYQLKQLHFHTPSEHQIDGITYPMEMHIVNVMNTKEEGEPPHYLVISYLFRMGEEEPFIASFLDEVPTEKGNEELAPGTVMITPQGRRLNHEYYHYRGSLTTPPYTETVEWLIVKDIWEASPEQIRRINLLEGDNARRVQALYGRKVEE